jgi:hypothetical protein
MIMKCNFLGNHAALFFLFFVLTLCQSSAFGSKIDLKSYGAKGNGLDDDTWIIQDALNKFDSVIVPTNYKCLIKSTLKINSNNVLLGKNKFSSRILIDADRFQWAEVYNPAVIINSNTQRNTNLADFEDADTNLRILNLTFELSGSRVYNMQSLIRLSGVKNVVINNCIFSVRSKSNMSHNSIIDLHAAYANVSVVKCIFNISTANKRAGGGIWIQNTSGSDCKDVEVSNCTFNVDSKDEALAIYTTGLGKIRHVNIKNNKFYITSAKETNVSILSIFNNVSHVVIEQNFFSVNSQNKNTIDGVIRLGIFKNVSKTDLSNVIIKENLFSGSNSNYIGIKGYAGDNIEILGNKFQGNNKGHIKFEKWLQNWRVE